MKEIIVSQPQTGNFAKTITVSRYDHSFGRVTIACPAHPSYGNPGGAALDHPVMENLRDALIELYPLPVPKTTTPVMPKPLMYDAPLPFSIAATAKAEWETVTNTASHITSRLRVPGGFLYRSQSYSGVTTETFVSVKE